MTPADQQALHVIGINMASEVHLIRSAPTPDEARKRLENLKERARKALRQHAKTLHPDCNGGDEGKTRMFIAIGKAVDALCKLELRVQPPPQMRRPIHVQVFYGQPFGTYTSSTTTASTTNTYSAWRVVNMWPT